MEFEKLPVRDVAQLMLDMYYQDFSAGTDFIQMSHAINWVQMAYAAKLNDSFQLQKRINKQDTGFTAVEMTLDWLTYETLVPVRQGEDIVVKINGGVFAFDYDKVGSGVQRVNDLSKGGDEMIRVSTSDRWKYKRMPVTSNWYYALIEPTVIALLGAGNVPAEVRVAYVPFINVDDGDAFIPVSKSEEIAKGALQLLLIAKNGKIIDKSNDQNPNVLPGSEINPDLSKTH